MTVVSPPLKNSAQFDCSTKESATVEASASPYTQRTETPPPTPRNSQQPSFYGPDVTPASYSAIWMEWCRESTIGGLAHTIHQSYFPPKRGLWWLVMIICSALLGVQMSSVIADYREYSTVTSIQTEFTGSLQLPLIVICNAATYQQSKIQSTTLTQIETLDDVLSLSQSLQDMIVSTTLNYNTNFENLEEVWKPEHTAYGLCWRFEVDDFLDYSGESGIIGGLQVLVDLQQDEYPTGSNFVGLRVFLQERRAPQIWAGTPSVFVSPGVSTYVALSVEEIHRETESPWSNCVASPVDYSQETCRTNCYAQSSQVCTCSISGIAINPLYCNLSAEINCTGSILWDEFTQCRCDKPPCRETVYKTQTSMLRLANTHNLVSNNVSADYFRDNIAHVVINYDAIQKTVATESKKMSRSQLVANIGGSMGLFLGISVISLVEVFELLALRLLPRMLLRDRRLYGFGGTE